MCRLFAYTIIILLFQVVGKKYIRLYPASLCEELYPHGETMLFNSSQVTAFLKFSFIFWNHLDELSFFSYFDMNSTL